MKAVALLPLLLWILLPLSACASPPSSESLSQIEVVFADASPGRAFEAVGPVTTRHWSVDEGIQVLRQETAKLGADAVVNVAYSEFAADIYRQGQFDWSRRRGDESTSTSQIEFEFYGLAVRWVPDQSPAG